MNPVIHSIPPLFQSDARVIILGSFPSVKSRDMSFFYMHPQNRFWKVLSTVLGCPFPNSISERKDLILSHRLALWDVVAECTISGSSDSSLKALRLIDIKQLIGETDARAILINGSKAYQLFQKIDLTFDGDILKMPSTSPANASIRLEQLIEHWSIIKNYIA